jgi:hypothetical protein
MIKFDLIQGAVQSDIRSDVKFHGIKLKDSSNSNVFLSCDEYGHFIGLYPGEKYNNLKKHRFAFIDYDDIKLFKGNIYFVEEEDLYFAECFDERLKNE